MSKFVICGKDCNKHESKIFNVLDTIEECIKWLNIKGKKLYKTIDNFDIQEYKVCDKRQEILGSEISYQHLELLKKLYHECGHSAGCFHKGEIHILCLEKSKGMHVVYDFLDELYM